MNNLLKVMFCGVLLVASGVSLAKCPNNLSAEQMYDCIVEEGAGGTYVIPKTTTEAKTQATNDTTSANSENDKVAQANIKK